MESDSNSDINRDKYKTDIKLEIKEEPNGTLTQVKSEYEGFETVFVASHFVRDIPDDSEMYNKIKIKEEPGWPESTSNEIKQEMELSSVAEVDLKNEIKEMPTSMGEIAPTELQRSNPEPSSSEGSNTSRFYNVASWETKFCSRQDNENTGRENSTEQHGCDFHEKSLNKNLNLRRKGLINRGKKLYNCEICGKSLSRFSNLKQHYMIHGDIRPHECTICGKGFKQMAHLRSHNAVHVDKRPYRCETCGKTFKQTKHLKAHGFIHEGRKSYECEICKKSFQRSSNLKNHIRIHDDKRPYKCEVCEKRFSQSLDLKRHNAMHEKANRYEFCEKLLDGCQIQNVMIKHDGKTL